MQNQCHVLATLFLCWFAELPVPAYPAVSPVPAHGLSNEKAAFGRTSDGQDVDIYTLRNTNGLTVEVLTYGATIYSVQTPDRNGQLTNITANCGSLADYENRSPCFGALLGRYANRIAGAHFLLNGQEVSLSRNAGSNQIHGGFVGFHKHVWQAQRTNGANLVALRLSYRSKDGEEGFPGTLNCLVVYELNNQNELKMEYRATTDRPTVINLSNHAYWNLAGAQSGNVLSQVLTLNADKYLPADAELIPTGEILSVEKTPLDFRQPHRIGERLNQITGAQFGGGYDHCLVLNHQQPGDVSFCARLVDPQSGRTMEVFTTQPGVQIFTANFPTDAFVGPHGYRYPKHFGLCLETQHFPDSPNKPAFPSTILLPGDTYHVTTVHKFGLDHPPSAP